MLGILFQLVQVIIVKLTGCTENKNIGKIGNHAFV